MSTKIKILSQKLVDQIAAGEVVERPASVVKELVENSIDAGASFVEIEVLQGGRDKIVVRDNGMGMSADDLRLACKRYATSKIDTVDDLTSIKTFGFRGEALSSIAAVSRINVKTAVKGAVQGTELILEGSKEQSLRSCAHPQGTTIVVSDLFYNLPVRKKFLKTAGSEFGRIRDWVVAQSLACPEIGFLLRHNQREAFNFPPGQTWDKRVQTALNISLDDFVPISIKTEHLEINGVASLVQVARRRRTNQFLFVNQRFLQNKTVWGAVREAYKGILPAGLHPQYVIDLRIREDLIDVNVHPRKEEVRFVVPSLVFDAVVNAIRSALSRCLEDGTAPIPSVRRVAKPQSDTTGVCVSEKLNFSYVKRGSDYVHSVPVLSETGFDQRDIPANDIFQIGLLYIVVLKESGFLIYDQHAVEEKILLVEFIQQFKEQQTKGYGQELLFPEKMDLSDSEREVLEEQQGFLERLGFRFSFSENSQVFVEAVPVNVKDRNIKQIILGFIDDCLSRSEYVGGASLGFEPGIDRGSLQALTYLACRSAVKQGERLSVARMRALVDSVERLGEQGASCPHGRPTKIKLLLEDLHKMFKRR
ncbi:DNA mismatch repair endonuclease MutL [Patescibacteria group bacterium]|nr:DNA mismatch repair endonuclease MutL [Patescibacteria group bacterium]MBU1868777.1 DNA mismatch repair endonuclease MutL [Patescibacteria group bacterium]